MTRRRVSTQPDIPGNLDDILKPAWTSPSWWTGVLVTLASLATGMAAWIGHPLHGAIPNSIIGGAALLAASVATLVINHSRAHVVAAAMAAHAAVHAAAINADPSRVRRAAPTTERKT